MTSSAVRSPKPSVFVSRRAVVTSRVPASADRCTRLASSCGVRAPESSSGSIPMARRNALAEPLSARMSGLATVAKMRTGSATTFAVVRGAEMPRNCGSSSPKTIEKAVASTRARRTGDGLDRWLRQPDVAQRAGQEAADRRLGEVADDESRDGCRPGPPTAGWTAAAGTGRPGRGRRRRRSPSGRSAGRGRRARTRSDEDGGAARQEDRCEQEQPLRHRILTVPSPRRYGPVTSLGERCG